jgi:formylglycine-generating enzyme required for sulfatase activity
MDRLGSTQAVATVKAVWSGGGSWNFQPVDLRASGRYKLPAVLRFLYVGFRLVQDISE